MLSSVITTLSPTILGSSNIFDKSTPVVGTVEEVGLQFGV